MRSVFIFLAMGLVVSLHIYSIRAGTKRSPDEAKRQPVAVCSPIVRLADAGFCQPGDRITVAGRISGFWAPASKRAPHTVILRDDSGSLEVVHWLEKPLEVSIGDSVECSGTVDLYRGELQLRLWSARDMHRRDSPDGM